jgi:hypothetical protein
VSHAQLLTDANRVLSDIHAGREIPGTKPAKKAITYLVGRGLVLNTPETTPRLRLTDRGLAALEQGS